MIDTIRFKVPLEAKTYERIRQRSTELEQRDNDRGVTNFRVIKNNLKLGSFDRNVNIFINEDLVCYIEFSVPKYLYGHNVFLVYAEEVQAVLESLQKKLASLFCNFPQVFFWELERIDLCYAWKLQNHDDAVRVMSILQNLIGIKTQKYQYQTSVMFKGKQMTSKFYLKDDEFYTHDFKELKKMGHYDLAYKMLDISKGVLRFELTLRKQAINRLFYGVEKGDCYFIPYLFTTDICQSILRKRLRQLTKLSDKKAVTLDQAHERLVGFYGKTKGFHLYGFYRVYFNEPNGRDKILKSMTRQQIWYNLRKLQLAGVGLTNEDAPISYDLNIPSDFVVNESNLSPRQGGKIAGMCM